ncbi:MAG: hypothetical protein ACLQF0_11665 [Dissulfurispiraceae bacterium]
MRTQQSLIWSSIALLLIAVMAGPVFAEEQAINGTVKSIDLSTGNAVIATYEGKDIPVTVEDKKTLDKFEDKRIRLGDDVKVRYITKDDKNITTFFRRLAGCF